MVGKMMETKKVDKVQRKIIDVNLGPTPGTNSITDNLVNYEIITKYIKDIKELIKSSNFDCYDPSVQNYRPEVKRLSYIEEKIKTIEEIYSGKKRKKYSGKKRKIYSGKRRKKIFWKEKKKIEIYNFPDGDFKYLKELYISLLRYETWRKYNNFSHIEGYM